MVSKGREGILSKNIRDVRAVFSIGSLPSPLPEDRKWSIVGGMQWDNGDGR